MTPRELSDAELIAEFERRKQKQTVMFLAGAADAIAMVFIAQFIAANFPAVAHSFVAFGALQIALLAPAIVAIALFSRRNWRCPACDAAFNASDMGGGMRYYRRGARCLRCNRQLSAG